MAPRRLSDVRYRQKWGLGGQALQDFGGVRKHCQVAKPAISNFLESVKSTVADCMLGGASDDEVATTWFAPSPVTASGVRLS